MKTNIQFYLDGLVKSRISQLTALDSPLKIKTKFQDCYVLQSKDFELEQIIYESPDAKINSEPTHIKAQLALSFQPKSVLRCGTSYLTPQKINAVRSIMNYLSANDISAYMTATNELAQEVLVKGHNPLTNTEIQNLNFNKKLIDLLD